MARLLLHRRYWDRYKDRINRLTPGVAAAWSAGSYPPFIDYWPDVPGTVPEKMVFNELVRREINFYYSIYFGDMWVTPNIREHYRPDFYLPDYKIVIEVYGLYWHTRPGMWEYDAVRALVYTASGYKFYVLTDFEIYNNVREAVGSIPEIAAATIKGHNWVPNRAKYNPTAALAARQRKWPKVGASHWARSRRANRRALIAWPGMSHPHTAKLTPEALVTKLTPEVIEAAQQVAEIRVAAAKKKRKKKKPTDEVPPVQDYPPPDDTW